MSPLRTLTKLLDSRIRFLESRSPLVRDGPKMDGGRHRKKVETTKVYKPRYSPLKRSPYYECDFNETDYYFENGLRKVYPYPYSYYTPMKENWNQRLLYEILGAEFRVRDFDAVKESIRRGLVLVNRRMVPEDYRPRGHDVITSRVHRHELPVLGCPLKIIHEDEQMLVIDKPPSLPVHPCGRYRYNSVLFILAREHNQTQLQILHRLDRLTSGVLMFSKDPERTKFMFGELQARRVRKEYLCRVEGEFPDGEVVADGPIDHFCKSMGISRVAEEGKESVTVFKKLSYNGKSSVVLAQPKQGRLHQIRVHLQYLGYPIVNDHLYNSEVFGKNKAKGGITEVSLEELISRVSATAKTGHYRIRMTDEEIDERRQRYRERFSRPHAVVEHRTDDFFKNYPRSLSHYIDEEFKSKLIQYDERRWTFRERCDECESYDIDPLIEDALCYLHCYRYSGEGFEYSAMWPTWAEADWVVD